MRQRIDMKGTSLCINAGVNHENNQSNQPSANNNRDATTYLNSRCY